MTKYQIKMQQFVNSIQFTEKNVKLENNEYKDKKTVFAIITDNLDTIKKYSNPIILLSANEEILNIIGKEFRASEWSIERLNQLTGDEFDYIILRQFSKRGLKPEY